MRFKDDLKRFGSFYLSFPHFLLGLELIIYKSTFREDIRFKQKDGKYFQPSTRPRPHSPSVNNDRILRRTLHSRFVVIPSKKTKNSVITVVSIRESKSLFWCHLKSDGMIKKKKDGPGKRVLDAEKNGGY